MKNKNFYIRMINLLLIAVILTAYQGITNLQAKNEELAKIQSELTSAEKTIADVNAQVSSLGVATTSQNKPDSNKTTEYADGTYTGEAHGFGGPIEVEVQIINGTIASIEILSAKNEDPPYLEMADSIIDTILECHTTDVDTISGATYSSTGIKNATIAALKKAVKE